MWQDRGQTRTPGLPSAQMVLPCGLGLAPHSRGCTPGRCKGTRAHKVTMQVPDCEVFDL